MTVKFGNKEIKWLEKQTFVLSDGGVIDNAAKEDITDKIIGHYNLPALPEDWSWEWFIHKGIYAGNFGTRVGKYYYRVHKRNLEDNHKTWINNRAKRGTMMDELTFDFTNEFNWRDGEFGDDGSCFWGGRAGAKEMILSANGFAFRVFKSNVGHGRCWIIPRTKRQLTGDIKDDDKEVVAWVLFNAYGDYLIEQYARFLAGWAGLKYKEIQYLKNLYSDSGTLYINRGMGVALADEDVLKVVPDNLDFNIDVIDADESGFTCYGCEEYFEGEPYNHYDGDPYCEYCWDELFYYCEDCSTYYREHDVTYVESIHDYVCDDCLSNRYYRCNSCLEYFIEGDVVIDKDSETWCNSCAEANLTVCDECSEYVEDIEDVDGRPLCEDCANKLAADCANCDDKFLIKNLKETPDGDKLCEDCYYEWAEAHIEDACPKCHKALPLENRYDDGLCADCAGLKQHIGELL